MADQELVAKYRKLLRLAKPVMDDDGAVVIRQAYRIAEKICLNRPDHAGKHLIHHTLDIALIVAGEMGLGRASIIGALLYNIHEDPGYSREDIIGRFGKQEAEILDGLIKISQVDTQHTTYQSENFRELLLNLASDIRVIMIKLAERLADMRKLHAFPVESQIAIATETFHLYAPLAHRLGLYPVKSEMEDLSMSFTHRKEYTSISKKIKETEGARKKYINEFIRPVKSKLGDLGLGYRVTSRTKSVHSIWKKMQQQEIPFEEVYDIFAIRIILDSDHEREKVDVWQAYSVVTDFYQPNPQRLRDWISIPKSNGYESLHTTVVGLEGRWVEVQIRTARMHEIAEKGLAAHWKYKEGKAEKGIDEWLNRMRDLLESSEPETNDFIDTVKLSLYSDDVFVFTPTGELRRLPVGASVLDFAFEIHTDVGYHCVGARVNQRNVPIKYKLQNGDQVEIHTSNNQKPKSDWLNHVVTSKAKSKIKQALSEEKLKAAAAGKEILQRRLRNWKIPFSDPNVKKLINHFRLKTAQELYAMIYEEKLELAEVKEVFTAMEKDSEKTIQPPAEEAREVPVKKVSLGAEDFLVIDEHLNDLDYKLSQCCNPIFGDDIFGFVTINEGVKIHRTSCPNARQLIAKYDYRILKAHWKKTLDSQSFQTVVRISGIDELGMVNKISDVISKDLKVNMRSISIETQDGMFEGVIKLFVTSTTHLEGLLRKLVKIKGVLKAVRFDEPSAEGMG